MSFATRSLSIDFTLHNGQTFGGGGGTTANISGLRISAKVTNAGGMQLAQLDARIYGLPLSVMNAVSTFGLTVPTPTATIVTLKASSSDGDSGVVFEGNISAAFADFSAMPDVPLVITAHAGGYAAIQPAPPTTVKGVADVGQMLAALAGKIGVAFENAGVNVKLSNPYFPGTLREQALGIVRAAGSIEWTIERGVLAIWPRNSNRGDSGAVISPQTGLVGYPTFTANGMLIRTLFNASVVFGSSVTVKSSIEQASKTWTVYSITHDLESETPNGQWFTTLQLTRPPDSATAAPAATSTQTTPANSAPGTSGPLLGGAPTI